MTRTELLTIAKPILFNTPMVQAIQDDRKTETRRVVKPHNPIKSARCGGYHQGNGLWISFENRDQTLYIKDYSVSACWLSVREYIKRFAAYKPGDILYVRETWYREFDDVSAPVYYRADYNERMAKELFDEGWHPSIHMPKEAARLFLRVTGVRVERLQDITPLDCEREGAFTVHTPILREDKETYLKVAHDCMRSLWNCTIKPADLPLYSWDANPWVWVIEFERLVPE